MPKIALIGAAGAVGGSIASALRSEGAEYRAVGRERAHLEKSFGADRLAEIVTWDPNDAASVRAACRGIETLIYLVGVPYHQFELHPALMQKTLDGAIAESVRRVVLVGTVYPYGRPQTPEVTEQHPREPHTFKGRMRKMQEDVLLNAHGTGQIEGVIVRLPDFYGPGVQASFLHSVFQAAANGGTANLIGRMDTPHQFVYVPDIGPVVMAVARKPEAYGAWWNFAGSGATTQREVVDQVFAMAGRKPKTRLAGTTMLRILGIFNPMLREMVEMNYLWTTPVLLNDAALESLIGPVRRTSYADGLRASLEAARGVTARNSAGR